jgi:hypothetical protein
MITIIMIRMKIVAPGWMRMRKSSTTTTAIIIIIIIII